jgi:hypothetical protein
MPEEPKPPVASEPTPEHEPAQEQQAPDPGFRDLEPDKEDSARIKGGSSRR